MGDASFKQLCIQLRRQDKTLGEIVVITGRPKTSVWFHIRDIPLSQTKMQRIKGESGSRIRKEALKRRGVSKKSFKHFIDWNRTAVLLVSHLLCDGEMSPRSVVYNNKNRVLIERVEKSMQQIYSFKPIHYTNPETGVHRISYHNVALAKYLKNKGQKLALEIGGLGPKLQLSFLRAFFDDEGCVTFDEKRNKRLVRGYQHDRSFLELVQKLLRNFKIESKINKSGTEITISRKENLIRFRGAINFSPGVRVNGARSNSIWKESIEKREILDRAVNSYMA